VIVRSLRARLLVAFLLVVAVSLGTVAIAVLVIGPGYFSMAMGHVPGDPLGEQMGQAVHAAFTDAIRQALLAATVIAIISAAVVSLAVAARIARPISGLADAARRVADGHYAERVPVDEPGEIGQLAMSFNEMATSLEATERRRVQLVGDVAHELRTPLTTLGGYLEGLQDGVFAPTPETWRLLQAETDRLTRMVADLSELWRAEAHQISLRIEPVDLDEVVEGVAGRFTPLAAAGNVVIDHPASSPPALADRDRVAQILSNYISNALRYAPKGSVVTISIERVGDRVRLGVRDRGRGLEPEQLESVFERFYRVDPARSRAAGGSGIGLAIARALAQAMDGHTWAERPADGPGVTFFLDLPAV
jgi:signal transduction histidine kinase